MSRVTTQWNRWEFNPQHSSYKAELFLLNRCTPPRIKCQYLFLKMKSSIQVQLLIFKLRGLTVTKQVAFYHVQKRDWNARQIHMPPDINHYDSKLTG